MIGDWMLRADRGATGRANSLWPTGLPDGTVPEAVDRMEAWYRERGLPPRVMIYDHDGGSPLDELSTELDVRGYRVGEGATIMVAPIDTLRTRHGGPLGGGGDPRAPSPWQVEAGSEPTSSSVRLMADEERMAEVTATCLPQRFVAMSDEAGSLLGGGIVTVDGGWFGLFGMKTMPHALRRGVATAVVAALAAEAGQLGAERAWLQVMASNGGARRLYEGFGFIAVHGYHYRVGL